MLSSSISRRTALVLLTSASLTPAFAFAQASSKRKINIAGRQRMLSQRMAMACFMIRLEIGASSHLEMLASARALFDASLKGLRAGSAELDLPVEENPSVLAALERVETSWESYGATIDGVIASGTVSTGSMHKIARTNLKLLSRANVVVKKLVSAYGGLDVAADVARAIDVAGRQRMLSQKMAKEAAMIGLKLDIPNNRVSLRETIEMFDNSLWALMNGDDTSGIPKPPQPVLDQLKKVEQLWLDTYPVLGEVADKGRADFYDLTEIALNQNPLLTDMNEAVSIYDKIG